MALDVAVRTAFPELQREARQVVVEDEEYEILLPTAPQERAL
jgi:hypothetical protein